MIELTGKTLSVELTQGIIAATRHLLGNSGNQAIINKAYYEWTNTSSKTGQTTDPLTEYHLSTYLNYQAKESTLEPLDYAYLYYYTKSFGLMYGERGGKGLLLRTGAWWWDGHIEPEFLYKGEPNPRYTDGKPSHALSLVMLPLIFQADPAIESLLPSKEKWEAVLLVLPQVFQAVFAMPIQTTIAEDTYHVEILDCLMCLNKLEECRIWWGVVTAILNWAVDLPKIGGLIDGEVSTAHHLILTWQEIEAKKSLHNPT